MTTELQPNLNKQLKQLQDEKANPTDSTDVDIDDQIKAVNASINGWKEILGRPCGPLGKSNNPIMALCSSFFVW